VSRPTAVSDVQVRQATHADIDAVAQVMAEAFADYPWTRWTVDADRHVERIAALQRLMCDEIVLPYGELWTARLEGEIVAAAAWLRPDSNVPQYVWRDVADYAAPLHGDRWKHNEDAEALAGSLRPTQPVWYFGGVGVRPSAQRRGLGRAVLAPVLAKASDAPQYLETSAAGNVEFYRGLGFEVTGHLVVPHGGPWVWGLMRPASDGPCAARAGSSP
jgi:ribosomal protein S18 acetylase RimI-like enzyme